MGVPIFEQETHVSFMRDEDKCIVYTSDSTTMTKLDKLANDPYSPWELIEEATIDGDVVGKKYTAPKKLISFRSKVTTRDLTDEQRAEMGERLRNIRKSQSDN